MTNVAKHPVAVAKAIVAVLLAVSCLVPSLLCAQQSKPTTVPAPRESQAPPRTNQLNPPSVLRAQSNIVRIDIEVTGRDGKPIKGLRADQFVITDDGKDQKISSFSYADIEASRESRRGRRQAARRSGR